MKYISEVNDERIILILKREWFEKIRFGEKRIEYRKVGPYWIGRFCRPVRNGRGVNNGYAIREFKTVEFRCGYSKKDVMVFEIANIDIGPCPYEGWDGDYFRIYLGALLVIERNSRGCARWYDDFSGGEKEREVK